MTQRNESLDLHKIGIRIRTEREKLGLSREKFAEILNLSSHYIGQIERGDRTMSLGTLIKVSQALNTSTDYLLKGYTHYMKNLLIADAVEDNYKEETDEEIKDLLSLLSGTSKDKIKLIKDLAKLILPHNIK